MKRRLIALSLAVVLGLSAAGLVWAYVSSVRSQVAEDDKTVTVLVARESIPAHSTGEAVVESNLVTPTEIPARYAAAGALTSEAQLRGKVVSNQVAKGQQVVETVLSAPEAQGLSFELDKATRAVSIPIDRVKGVGGLIRPGDRVDVLATFKYEVFNEGNVSLGQALGAEERKRIQEEIGVDIGASKSSVTRVILQQVKVLRVDPVDRQNAEAVKQQEDDQGDTEAPNSPVAVLLVSLQDAEKLVYAQQEGEVAFALVAAEDTIRVATPGHSIVNVFHESPPLPATDVTQVSASDSD